MYYNNVITEKSPPSAKEFLSLCEGKESGGPVCWQQWADQLKTWEIRDREGTSPAAITIWAVANVEEDPPAQEATAEP